MRNNHEKSLPRTDHVTFRGKFTLLICTHLLNDQISLAGFTIIQRKANSMGTEDPSVKSSTELSEYAECYAIIDSSLVIDDHNCIS